MDYLEKAPYLKIKIAWFECCHHHESELTLSIAMLVASAPSRGMWLADGIQNLRYYAMNTPPVHTSACFMMLHETKSPLS